MPSVAVRTHPLVAVTLTHALAVVVATQVGRLRLFAVLLGGRTGAGE